ncbi:MAG TPA: hypothetical protein VFY16_06890 [Gemmatimonadaceae bacterium]|nr:hypothetical protein [Gemmatimonadaceae bacterium]
MTATEVVGRSASATLRATVDFPDPDPPAIPITIERERSSDPVGVIAGEIAVSVM